MVISEIMKTFTCGIVLNWQETLIVPSDNLVPLQTHWNTFYHFFLFCLYVEDICNLFWISCYWI